MRKIPLRVIPEQVPGRGEINFDYAEVLLTALRSGGIEGLTVKMMEDRLGAIDKIEKARREKEEYILLEEQEHKTLIPLVEAYRFAFLLRSAIQFRDEVVNAPQVDVEVKAEWPEPAVRPLGKIGD